MKAISALVRRDLAVAMRQGSSLGTAIGFFLTVVMLLPIGLGPDQALMQRIAPGALWIALLLSVLLSADRIFLDDYDDGSLELLASGPLSFEVVTLAKAGVHWLTAGLPLAIIAPALGFLVNIGPDQAAACRRDDHRLARHFTACRTRRCGNGGPAAGRDAGLAADPAALCAADDLRSGGQRAAGGHGRIRRVLAHDPCGVVARRNHHGTNCRYRRRCARICNKEQS